METVYEDKDIMLVEKPQGIPSQQDKTGDKDMLSLVKEYLDKNDKHTYLLHRLDRPVGGLMLFAKSQKASEVLSKSLNLKNISKTYLAVVCGEALPQQELKNYLLKNGRLNTSKVVQKGVKNAKEAILYYETLNTVDTQNYGKLSLVKVKLVTGRHHQIRVQFANIGLPIWGDTKYNKLKYEKGFINIALWSYSLKFNHPITKKEIQFKLSPKDIYPFNIEGFKLYYV